MKKDALKIAPKLTINRETLRSLQQSEMTGVAGGATLSLCVGSCGANCTRVSCTC
jgi:hypothetical protein